jgi:hypothetical protein
MADRVLPHNLEAERAVLGAVLVENSAYAVAAEILTDATFFRVAHGQVWRAIAALIARREAPDLVTVSAELDRVGHLTDAGGPAYVASLVDGVARSTNVEHYARIVRDHAARRALIAEGQRLITRGYEATDTPTDLAEDAVAGITAVRARVETGDRSAGVTIVTARETCADQATVPMVLPPYVPAGSIGSVIGKVKDGKTSTLLEMVRCIRRGEPFCGFPPPEGTARVLIASEQPRTSLAKQLQDAGLQGDDGVLITYLSDAKGRPWSVVGPALVQCAMDQVVTVLIVDTASRWFGFKGDEENQSGGAEHVDVFLPFCAVGGTVLMSRHGRKSGGTASDAARGTTAIEGAADFILHLTRPRGHGPDVRQIEAVGRFEMPESVLIRRRPQLQLPHISSVCRGENVAGPAYVFEHVHDGKDADSNPAKIRRVLSQGAKTVIELVAATGIHRNTVDRLIKDMPDVLLIGKGGSRKNASIYGLKHTGTTTPPQTQRGGDVEVAAFRGVQ